MNYADLIAEIMDIHADTILNPSQRARFTETTLHAFMLMLDAQGLEEIKSAIRLSRVNEVNPPLPLDPK